MGNDRDRYIRITAETIRAERAARGITQAGLARVAGVPHQSYIRYEKGTRDIPMAVLVQIVHALDMSFVTFARRLEDRLHERERE